MAKPDKKPAPKKPDPSPAAPAAPRVPAPLPKNFPVRQSA